jgi:peptidyl-prolyl cis-trans isomerase A (cyclophilin A)
LAGTGTRVEIVTELGSILVKVNDRHAPVTACNFLQYVQMGRYDGGSFFRTVRSDRPQGRKPSIDIIQADGPDSKRGLDLPPIPLERTRETGIHHQAGTISMARDGPDTATSSFFIVVRGGDVLDYGGARNPDGQGFAAFGQIVSGMDIVERIQLRRSTDERLASPVRILRTKVLRGQDRCPKIVR